jgi:hypothetical protein
MASYMVNFTLYDQFYRVLVTDSVLKHLFLRTEARMPVDIRTSTVSVKKRTDPPFSLSRIWRKLELPAMLGHSTAAAGVMLQHARRPFGRNRVRSD